MTAKQKAVEEAGFVAWVIYDHPKDHPSHFVLRRWVNGTPDREAILCDTIQQAWDEMPRGLVKLQRDRCDDPVILETWI